MALYLIGDIQGCDATLARLLADIDFSPSRDQLYFLGDLVNRGPDSLGVLRRVVSLGHSARSVLGNHDLHLLAVAHSGHALGRHDTITPILEAPDRAELLDYLRQQPLAMFERGCLMVHAGVLPSWTATQTCELAQEVERELRGPGIAEFLTAMYGNEPAQWDADLEGVDRLRVIVNALTRLRFCTPEGRMEFRHKNGTHTAPAGYMPWFDVPERQTRDVVVAFGHWSALQGLQTPNLLGLDTGCVWGGPLSAFRWDDQKWIKVPSQDVPIPLIKP